MDYENMRIIKKLGSGMLGTTYLIENRNKKYALKVQHILEKDIKKNYKSEMWRELDLYKYISKLNKEEQKFFVKFYDYKIVDKCNHKQERPWKPDEKTEFGKKLKELDESEYCLKYVIDYKGETTLAKYIVKNNMTIKEILSIMLQICKINYVLYEGGYSHGDLHPGNIMINRTKDKYFKFMNEKIPYEGIQLSAIDYGNVQHKKFGIIKRNNLFYIDREKYLFNDIFWSCDNVINNMDKLMDRCKKLKQKLPWEKDHYFYDNLIRKIYNNHEEFFMNGIKKYLIKFPGANKYIYEFCKKINNKKSFGELINKKLKNKVIEINDIWSILENIVKEFKIFYPEKYMKYSLWCGEKIDEIIPIDLYLELLYQNNYIDYCNLLIKKIKVKR